MNRKARDRRVAQEFADELTKALGGPAMPPEALTANRETVGEIFGRVLDRHQIVNEAAAACVLACVPRVLAKNFKSAELNRRRRRDAARNVGEGYPEWPALSPETLAHKIGGGPLLETGEMRDSIRHEVVPEELAVVVGSNDKRALFQELGTSRIPPRSFLGLAMAHSMPFAAETFSKIAVKILTEK
jgi:phage gpG-like protein